MAPVAKILCVSPDPVVLQTRRWILEGYFQVNSAARFAEAAAMIASQSYSLVLLCYSLKTEECGKMIDLVRTTAPHTQMLALVECGESCGEAFACPKISVLEGPYALLKKVAQMIAPEIAGKIRRSSRRAIAAAKLPPAAVLKESGLLPRAKLT